MTAKPSSLTDSSKSGYPWVWCSRNVCTPISFYTPQLFLKSNPSVLARGAGVFWAFSSMAGMHNCPCCHVAEEPKVVPMSTQSLATTLAPADKLWSTSRDKAVKLRMEGSGPGSETPVTIHQMFLETVEKSADQTALIFKQDGQSASLTWREYYEKCRAAAKSFLKVCNWIQMGQFLDCMFQTKKKHL